MPHTMPSAMSNPHHREHCQALSGCIVNTCVITCCNAWVMSLGISVLCKLCWLRWAESILKGAHLQS